MMPSIGRGAMSIAKASRPEQQDDKAAKHLQGDMARQHVREQTHGERDRPRQERDDLDQHDEGQDDRRDARRGEKIQEVGTVPRDAIDDHDRHDERGEGEGDGDLARHRVGEGAAGPAGLRTART